MRNLKSRMTSILLMMAVWAASLCVFLAPAHACCPQSALKKDSALPACCVSNVTTLPKALPETGGSDPCQWVSPAVSQLFEGHWLTQKAPKTISLLATRHIADQSNRHQELNVWLN